MVPSRERESGSDEPADVVRYECADCHHRLRATLRPMHCPDCGGTLRRLEPRRDA